MAVIVVIVLGLITLAILASALSSTGEATIDSYVPSHATGSNSYVDASVTKVYTLTSDNYHLSHIKPWGAPEAGKKYVLVAIEHTNTGDDSSSIYSGLWDLHTSDGQVHDYEIVRNSDVPDGLQPGATATYHIVYEVDESAEPVALEYDAWTTRDRFTIPLAR